MGWNCRLWSIGSLILLGADLSDWWENNRVGCAFDASYRPDYEKTAVLTLGPPDTWTGWLRRKERGGAYFVSIIGSAWYLIGSVLIVPSPELNLSFHGLFSFIIASVLILVAQGWKLFIQGTTVSGVGESYHRIFSWLNFRRDLAGCLSDCLTAVGAVGYLIGSTVLLCVLTLGDETDGFLVACGNGWVILGGLAYWLSSLALFYRYFLQVDDYSEDLCRPVASDDDMSGIALQHV